MKLLPLQRRLPTAPPHRQIRILGQAPPQSKGTKRKGRTPAASSSRAAKKPKSEPTPETPPETPIEITCISSDEEEEEEDEDDQHAGASTLPQQPPALPVPRTEPVAQTRPTLPTATVINREPMAQLQDMDYIPLSSPVSESDNNPVFAPADAAEPTVTPQSLSNPSAGTRRDGRPCLSEEQQRVVDLAVAGRNIFYTGSAGCGKSTVLHAIKRQLRDMGKKVKVMAPTGIAAMAIGGETIYRFAGWSKASFRQEVKAWFRSRRPEVKKSIRRKMEQVDVIIIDEISMVQNHDFERLNRLLKVARGDDPRAFGGVQVIVTGDFCQLPPVKPFEFCLDCGEEMQKCHDGYETTYRCKNQKPHCPFHVEPSPWCEDCGDEMQKGSDRGSDTMADDFKPKPTFSCPTCPGSFVQFSPCCDDCGQKLVRGVNTTAGELMYRCIMCPTFLESQKCAFCSEAWKECNFEYIHLNGIHRQNDSDFISILQKCRIGEALSEEEVERLMDHRSHLADAMTLFPTKGQVKNKNDQCFRALRAEPHEYKSFEDFRWNGIDPQVENYGDAVAEKTKDDEGWVPLQDLADHRYPDVLALKEGMPVVLLANLDVAAGLCNGSQGIITGFEAYDPLKLPRRRNGDSSLPNEILMGDHADYRQERIQMFCQREEVRLQRRYGRVNRGINAGWLGVEDQVARELMFPRIRWLSTKTQQCVIYPDCQVTECGQPTDYGVYSLLSRTQVPLAPAWALTIQKSQGMTLDRVIVDLSRVFEEGQIYVALSRATSLEGLRVRGSRQVVKVGLGGNEQVKEFLQMNFGI